MSSHDRPGYTLVSYTESVIDEMDVEESLKDRQVNHLPCRRTDLTADSSICEHENNPIVSRDSQIRKNDPRGLEKSL